MNGSGSGAGGSSVRAQLTLSQSDEDVTVHNIDNKFSRTALSRVSVAHQVTAQRVREGERMDMCLMPYCDNVMKI